MTKNKKTKILAIGDIHGDTELVKKSAEKAKKENVDFIIIAGDLTWLEQSTKDLIGPFTKTRKPILLLPGNHESYATIDAISKTYPKTKNIHGGYVKTNNLGIFGAGHGDAGPFWIEDPKIFKLLKRGHEHVKDSEKKIMVTHMHPKGSKSEFSGFPGSKAVRKAIEKFHPTIAINSHIHEASGIEEKIGKTKVINVSRRAKVFEV